LEDPDEALAKVPLAARQAPERQYVAPQARGPQPPSHRRDDGADAARSDLPGTLAERRAVRRRATALPASSAVSELLSNYILGVSENEGIEHVAARVLEQYVASTRLASQLADKLGMTPRS